MLPDVSLQMLTKSGDVLQIAVPFGAPASREVSFWTPLAGSGDTACIGWVKFERRTVLSSKAVFEATELRTASAGEPSPVLSPPASIQLRMGEP